MGASQPGGTPRRMARAALIAEIPASLAAASRGSSISDFGLPVSDCAGASNSSSSSGIGRA